MKVLITGICGFIGTSSPADTLDVNGSASMDTIVAGSSGVASQTLVAASAGAFDNTNDDSPITGLLGPSATSAQTVQNHIHPLGSDYIKREGAVIAAAIAPSGNVNWETDGVISMVVQQGGSVDVHGSWIANHAYVIGDVVLEGGNYQIVSVAGTSGSSAPSWNGTLYGATTDNTVTWINTGTAPIYRGGASVAGSFFAIAAANNSSIWGINTLVRDYDNEDPSTHVAANVTGIEMDMSIADTGSHAAGINMNIEWKNGQPTNPTYGLHIQTISGSYWDYGVATDDQAATVAFQVGKSGSDSQNIEFISGSGMTVKKGEISTDQYGDIVLWPDSANNSNKIYISPTADIDVPGNVNASGDMYVTGNVNVTGNITSSSAFTGTFLTGDSRTATVSGGIITSVV